MHDYSIANHSITNARIFKSIIKNTIVHQNFFYFLSTIFAEVFIYKQIFFQKLYDVYYVNTSYQNDQEMTYI